MDESEKKGFLFIQNYLHVFQINFKGYLPTVTFSKKQLIQND